MRLESDIASSSANLFALSGCLWKSSCATDRSMGFVSVSMSMYAADLLMTRNIKDEENYIIYGAENYAAFNPPSLREIEQEKVHGNPYQLTEYTS